MITAVDSSVLLDVFGADAKFGPRSSADLRQCLAEGSLVACEAVWAETATAFPSERGFLEAMAALTIGFSATSERSALQAARSWRMYRQKGGRRQRVAADFLIGAHALEQCDRLLTRDRGFYRDYFGKLTVVDPSQPLV